MSFYIVSKGRLTPYQFRYLEEKLPPHVEPTQIHGEAPRPRPVIPSTEVFALEVMTRELITLTPAHTILQAKKLMQDKKVHHLPILIDQRLCGVLSQRDLPENPDFFEKEIRLHQVMAKLVVCAGEYTPLRHVAEVFLKENINSLPIVSDELKLVGIITHRDLLRWLIEKQKFQN
jgi:CBS domain-containing protein